MRTEIKIFSSKIYIQLTEDNSIDEEWNLWKLAVDKENKIQKELFTSREMLILDYGNRARNNDNIDELKKVCIESMGFRDIILSTKGWNKKELICADDLGNELYLENFETKTYEERLHEINMLIDTIQTKIEYLQPKNKSSQDNEKPNELCQMIQLKHHSAFLKLLDTVINERVLYKENCNLQEFASVAKIFFDKGWLKKDYRVFKKWLVAFSKYNNREISTYKENKLINSVEYIKIRYPFFDNF